MSARAKFTAAEIAAAKSLAEGAGLRLAGYEKRPDGTVKLEFGDPADNDASEWFAGSPLYRDARA